MNDIDIVKMKREALAALIQSLAKALGAHPFYYDRESNVIAMQIDPCVVEFLGHQSIIEAMAGAG